MQTSIRRVDNNFLFTRDDKTLFWGTLVTKRFKLIKQLYQKEKLIAEAVFKFRLPFRIFHTITLIETNKIITLKYTNIFKPKFVCKYNNDLYEFIPHKGHKTSIFKNEKQIGYYKDKKVEYLGDQTIVLVTNDDIPQHLIFTFILAIKCDFNNDYSTMSVDIGNFGPEVRKFDTAWKPSNIS